MQKTLCESVSISGKGLFTGEKVKLTMIPADANSGIVFKRTDLNPPVYITAKLDNVISTPRCTIVGHNNVTIKTVEHLLSAISALEIDNLLIEVDGPELPACDGSSIQFVDMIERAKIKNLKASKLIYKLGRIVQFSKAQTHLVAIPSLEFRISNTLNYPHSNFLGSQFYSFKLNSKDYKNNIAPSRTFSLYEEIEPMLKKGLLKGAGLENGVVVKDEKVMNPEGLRFTDEMVRHKILDLLGDLCLIGKSFLAHIIAIRPGHYANIEFAREILNNLTENP
jgi:UDP-3-O-[3-hydroxymyristoyl] N-acetylglucosamine deacetylase